MKTKLFSTVPKLPFAMVVIHSFLIVVAFGTCFLPSQQPDLNIGVILTFIIAYFIDLPVGILFWKIIWPNLSRNELWPILGDSYLLGIAATYSVFLLLGGLYWFCIGMIIEIILRTRRKIGGGPHKAKRFIGVIIGVMLLGAGFK